MPTDASHKLIPMTTFVIEYYSNEGYADLQILHLMNNYANFLKTPLTLGMFVPVDPQGNVLKEPKNYAAWKSLEHNDGNRTDIAGFEEYAQYQSAESYCMFEGFRVDYNQPTESIQLTLTMTEQTAKTFYESQLSKDQTITRIEENIVEVTATVPLTSQLVWWLRSFGKKLLHIEPVQVHNAVREIEPDSK